MAIQQIRHLVKHECDSAVYHKVVIPAINNISYTVWTTVSIRIARFETSARHLYTAIENEERNTNKPNSSTTKRPNMV